MKILKNNRLIFVIIAIWGLFSISTLAQIFSNPIVEKVAGGFIFVEGPVWIDGKGLVFSDIPGNTIYLFGIDSSISVFKNPSGNSNGLTIDKQGNLILCQHGLRQVSRLGADGSFIPLASKYKGKRLNSPNDIVVAIDGSVFFTDPPYGLGKDEKSETGFSGIYRVMPTGKLYLLDSTLGHPNGIVISNDQKKLYVDDSEERIICTWDIINDSTIANKTQIAHMEPKGSTDGMKLDSEGYLYSTGPGGIWIYSPDGKFLRIIEVPGQNTNCAWGDSDRKTLYVTAGNSLYRIRNKSN
jgi:sugar lactone lactonase YvrE